MEIRLRLGYISLRLLSFLASPIFRLLSMRKCPKVPPIKSNILLLSATVVAEKIRRRELKSETVVAAYIARIQEVNPLLNAVVEERFVEALQEARDVDTFLRSRDALSGDAIELQTTKPLLGVPITIKEACAARGMSLAVGTVARKGLRAEEDGDAVERIRHAGGIILLVSNTPEMCMYWESNNRLTGLTRNPYNGHYSAGGSSGGEGALLGAGASIIGIGSDVAGSIRMPALLNGVFGHKCTANMIATKGHFPNVTADATKFNFTYGPMVRYAEDLPLAFKILTDHSEALQLDEKVNLEALSVFYTLSWGLGAARIPVASKIKRAINTCVAHLRNVCGCAVDEYKFDMSNAMEISTSVFLQFHDFPNVLAHPESDKRSNCLIFELFKYCLGRSRHSDCLLTLLMHAFSNIAMGSRRKKYLDDLDALRQQFEDRLGATGVLLCPTFPTNAYQHHQFMFQLAGLPYQTVFNNLGLPCTNVPLGVDAHGLPIGIQVVAGARQDRLCFAVARELEHAFGGWQAPS